MSAPISLASGIAGIGRERGRLLLIWVKSLVYVYRAVIGPTLEKCSRRLPPAASSDCVFPTLVAATVYSGGRYIEESRCEAAKTVSTSGQTRVYCDADRAR